MLKYNSVKIKTKNNKISFKETYCKYTDGELSYIVVKIFNKDNTFETKSFCVNTTTGKSVTKLQILSKFGYDFDDVKEKIKGDFIASYEETSFAGKIVDRVFEATLKLDNVEIYVNSKGKICVDINNINGSAVTFKMKKLQK